MDIKNWKLITFNKMKMRGITSEMKKKRRKYLKFRVFELQKSWLNVASISNQNINEENNYTIGASESNGPQNCISGS